MPLRDKFFRKKQSGVLLSIFSLPSEDGIGTLGKEAFEFVDFLSESHQTLWQILPLCPIGKGNSPYSSYGAFAGEILLIDLQSLANDGLISEDEIPKFESTDRINYPLCRELKLPVLKKAVDNFNKNDPAFNSFKKEQAYWLTDYCLFMALRDRFGGLPFTRWEDPYKYRDSTALEEFKKSAEETISFYEITQFIFYKQYLNLKNYASSKGIKIIGDIPFYVQLNSADVWANSKYFRLSRDLTPVLVAGVPPDVFSSTGQLWGNPIYDWEELKHDDYDWWKKRLAHSCKIYDILRIDHFRAFSDYYTIPSGSKDATLGRWEKGVGIHFWNRMKRFLNSPKIIAEDLGGETLEVRRLIKATGFPDMKVLQFAFDSGLSDPFLPRNMNRNCVCYTGTHDNDTTLGWWSTLSEEERSLFNKLVPKHSSDSPVLSLISYGMNSRADTVIIPLQDYLCLPTTARTNTPGKPNDNWEWRLSGKELTTELASLIKELSANRNR